MTGVSDFLKLIATATKTNFVKGTVMQIQMTDK